MFSLDRPANRRQSALKHWARIIQRWPIDKVRPESVSFQKVMQRRLDRLTNPSLNATATSVKGNDALVSSAPPPTLDEQKELKQANALHSLLENRYATAYTLPEHLRHPASRPTHYDDVLAELEAAPGRSKFASMMQRLKGRFRLS
jgi:cytochrome b pre-mRNA-processing protein 6